MKHPAQQVLSLASARVPWLLPALGIAVFVHRHFIKYCSPETAGAKAKARLKSRPPKLRRVLQKTKSDEDMQVSPTDAVEAAEQERLAAAGLSSDKLMEWFTEDELEALQQAQANPAALLTLLSGTRFLADDGYNLDSGSDWYTNDKDNCWPDMLEDDSCAASPYAVPRGSEENTMRARPLSQLSLELAQSSCTSSAGTSPGRFSNQQDTKQQHWSTAQQLMQLPQHAAQQQHQQQSLGVASPAAAATVGSVSSGGDYFDPSHYFGISPAANKSSRTSLDIAQGKYLPMRGALWASSYPPHLDDLDFTIDEDHATAPESQQQQSTDRQRAAADSSNNISDNLASSSRKQQQQQPQQQQEAHFNSSRRWLQEYEPPMPDYEPDFDMDLGDLDYYYDYEPDYVPDFDDDDLGFDQLDAAFSTGAMQSMGDMLLSSH